MSFSESPKSGFLERFYEWKNKNKIEVRKFPAQKHFSKFFARKEHFNENKLYPFAFDKISISLHNRLRFSGIKKFVA
ncbi:MAG: hypothetical protein ACR2IA_01525 [Pyrinomonadaceae bacterium]